MEKYWPLLLAIPFLVMAAHSLFRNNDRTADQMRKDAFNSMQKAGFEGLDRLAADVLAGDSPPNLRWLWALLMIVGIVGLVLLASRIM